MTGSFPLDLVVFCFATVAPGLAVAWLALGRRDALTLGTFGVAIGVFLMPVLDFAVAMAFDTHIGPAVVVGVATTVLAVVAAIQGWRWSSARAARQQTRNETIGAAQSPQVDLHAGS